MNFIVTPLCNIRLISAEKYLTKSLSKSDKMNSVINKLFKFVAVISYHLENMQTFVFSYCFLGKITLMKRKLKYYIRIYNRVTFQTKNIQLVHLRSYYYNLNAWFY